MNRRTAEVLIAECGADMTRFPTASHLASWAGMCPGNNESGGKRRSGATRKGSKWLRKALVEAAHAAARSKGTYLSAAARAGQGPGVVVEDGDRAKSCPRRPSAAFGG